jgi:hypothetical protein
MITLGGIGHALPHLISNIHTATSIAVCVMLVELGIILRVRHRFMDTRWCPPCSKRTRRRAGVSGGNPDWEFVNMALFTMRFVLANAPFTD